MKLLLEVNKRMIAFKKLYTRIDQSDKETNNIVTILSSQDDTGYYVQENETR